MRTRLVAVLLTCIPACSSAPRPPAELLGTWVHYGPRTVRGRGFDKILEIAYRGASLVVRVSTRAYPDIGRGEVVVTHGPETPLTCDDAWLQIGDAEAATFRLDTGRLVYPGLAEVRPGVWRYAHYDAYLDRLEERVFACEHDPRLVPRGAATFATTLPTPQSYVASTDPETGTLLTLEFFEDGNDEPVVEFVWDDHWGLVFHGSGWYGVRERFFERAGQVSRGGA